MKLKKKGPAGWQHASMQTDEPYRLAYHHPHAPRVQLTKVHLRNTSSAYFVRVLEI